MPRLDGPPVPDDRIGKLSFNKRSSGCVDVLFSPTSQAIQHFRSRRYPLPEFPVRLIRIDENEEKFTTFPIRTYPYDDRFLGQKYSRIKRISLIGARYAKVGPLGNYPLTEEVVMQLLEELPSCFVKDYDYGLGLIRSHRLIVEVIEDLCDCTEICISGSHESGFDEGNEIFYISTQDFEELRKSINRINDNAREAASAINEGNIYNTLGPKIGSKRIRIQLGRSPIRQRITRFVSEGHDPLSEEEQDAVLDMMTRNAKSISQNKPEKLALLKSDIELVTLDNLIDRFQLMMKKAQPEDAWQQFLGQNPFILSLAFGYPILLVAGQAMVGGHRVSGSGGKIADFLIKNSLSNNCSIVEIKKPSTDILMKSPYRANVYAPSKDLSGAINQVLDQKFHLEKEITSIKDNSGIYDMNTYSVHCCIIIGRMPKNEEEVKSFELFRGNSKNVEILTFDELLERMRNLRSFLKSKDSAKV